MRKRQPFRGQYGYSRTPLYTVLLERLPKFGGEFVSHKGPGFFTTYDRTEADAHLDQCKREGFKGRVARIRVIVETVPPRKRKQPD